MGIRVSGLRLRSREFGGDEIDWTEGLVIFFMAL